MEKKILMILFYLDLILYGLAIYLYYFAKNPFYNKMTGIAVFWMVFVLLPYFLWYRYKDKKIEDFQFRKPQKKD